METIPCSHGAYDVNYCVSCLRALLTDTRSWIASYRDPNDGFALYAATPLLKRIDEVLGHD